MKIKNRIKSTLLLGILLVCNCVTTSIEHPVSYYTIVSDEKSDLAWGRIHSYIANVFLKPEIELSNKYIIRAGKIRVTREDNINQVIIRVTAYEFVEVDKVRIKDNKKKKNLLFLNELLLDMLEYARTGKSEYMITTDRLEMKKKLQFKEGGIDL